MYIRTVASRRFPWATWSTERLLQLRIKDLGLTIEGTWLEPRIDALYETLDRRGFRIRPHIWLSEEWFSPLGAPGSCLRDRGHDRVLERRADRRGAVVRDSEIGTHIGPWTASTSRRPFDAATNRLSEFNNRP